MLASTCLLLTHFPTTEPLEDSLEHASLKRIFLVMARCGQHAIEIQTTWFSMRPVRMLAPSSGMSEDPITGSLNAAIAKWLQAEGRLSAPYVAAQGTSIGRVGRVAVRSDTKGTAWIGGQVHILIDGHLNL